MTLLIPGDKTTPFFETKNGIPSCKALFKSTSIIT